jgi:adenosylhomocysteinase
MEDVVETADIFITTTGCYDVITADQMTKMKNKASVANIGHFDNEIDMAGLARVSGVTKTGECDKQVYTLPKHLDEKVARLHLDALGVQLTELTKGQAEYLGVDVAGPYKPEHYRY